MCCQAAITRAVIDHHEMARARLECAHAFDEIGDAIQLIWIRPDGTVCDVITGQMTRSQMESERTKCA